MKKKKLLLSLIVCVMLSIVTAGAVDTPVNLTVNHTTISQGTFARDGVTYIPVRGVIENLGGIVGYKDLTDGRFNITLLFPDAAVITATYHGSLFSLQGDYTKCSGNINSSDLLIALSDANAIGNAKTPGAASPYATAEDGKLWFTSAHPAIAKENHIFIPLRPIALMAGADISWDLVSGTVAMTKTYRKPSPVYAKIKDCTNTEVFKPENFHEYIARIWHETKLDDYMQIICEVNAVNAKPML